MQATEHGVARQQSGVLYMTATELLSKQQARPDRNQSLHSKEIDQMSANIEALTAACKGMPPREVRALFKSVVRKTQVMHWHESFLFVPGALAKCGH